MRIPHILFTFVANVISPSPLIPNPVRRALLRTVGIRIGHSGVAPGCFVGSPRLFIGHRSFVNVAVFFDGSGNISVGDRVHIAMGAMLLTSSHELGESAQRAGTLTASDVTIGNGAWIGARAIVMPGVTVGDGAIVAAGSVVTKSCEPNTLYAGIPARPVRRLDFSAASDRTRDGHTNNGK